MIYFLVLLFFFIYSISLFFINNIYILLLVFLFNIIISRLVKVSITKHLKVLKSNAIFIIFIILCNILFSDLSSSIKVGIRLFLTIDFTFIIGNFFNTTSLRMAFKYFLYPLKIFKIDIDNLTLIIAIAISFIPILSDEARMIKEALRSKGFNNSLKNVLTRPHIYVITFLNNLFDLLDEIEKSLRMKGY